MLTRIRPFRPFVSFVALIAAMTVTLGGTCQTGTPGPGGFTTDNNWEPLGSGMDEAVHALISFDGQLIAGGEFTTAGGSSIPFIARWNGSTWQAMSTEIDFVVFTLRNIGGTLYAVGGSGNNNSNVRRVARWNGAAWEQFGGDPGGAGLASIAGYNGVIYVVGNFQFIGPHASSKRIDNIATWDGAEWQGVGGGLDTNANEVIEYGGELVVGAGKAQSSPQDVIWGVAWNGTTWRPLGKGLSSSAIYEFANYKNNLYAAGSFTIVGSATGQNIARWDGTTWHPLGKGTINLPVSALGVFDDSLYVGGIFGRVDGDVHPGIVRWDGTTWHAVGLGLASDAVLSLTAHNNALYMGGTFSRVGTVNAERIVKRIGN